jgi:hypothetical protein
MKQKSILITVLLIVLLVSTISAEEKEFNKGQLFLTPQFAYYSYAPNIGVGLEYALTEKVGIGGSLMVASWSSEAGTFKVSQTLIIPAVDVNYHFTKVAFDKLDLFAGISIGYSIYSYSWDFGEITWDEAGTSSVYFSPVLGIRYYFSKKIALCLKSHYSALGDWSGMGGELGVTFRLGKQNNKGR